MKCNMNVKIQVEMGKCRNGFENKNDQKVYSCKHIIASNSTLISKRAKWFDLDMNEMHLWIAALVEQSKITIPIISIELDLE